MIAAESVTVRRVRSARRPSRVRQAVAPLTSPLGAGLGLIAVLTPLRGIWAAQLLLIALLLVLPGLALLRALRVPRNAVRATPVYAVCGSITVLLAAGLAVDLLGPAVGIAAPLRTLPLLAGLELVCAALLLAAPAPAEPLGALSGLRALRRRVLGLRLRVADLWPLLLPLAAAGGALRLTAGRGPGLAIAATAATLGALVAGGLWSDRLGRRRLALLVYAAALAALWSYALRGELVYGFDITTELHVFQSTFTSGIWHPNQHGNAYGAMLSLTVLPAALQALSGLSGVLVFKLLYPALFALVPVGVFEIARRFLTLRFAFLGSAFVVAQSSFAQEMVGVARQEIGLLLFVGLLAALLDRLPTRARAGLVAVLAVALAGSHYSTAYLALVILGIAVLLRLGLRLVRPVRPIDGATLTAFLALGLSAVVWYGPVTQSWSNVAQLESTITSQGLRLLPEHAGQGLLSGYLSGNTTTQISAQQYERLAAAEYAHQRPWVVPARSATDPRYALRDSTPPGATVRAQLPSHAVNLGTVALSELADLLAAAGLLWVALRGMRAAEPPGSRDSRLRQLALIGVATLAVLTAIRLSGTLALAYNQQRALLQAAVPLVVGIGVVLEAVARRPRLARPVGALSTLAVATLFFAGSGLAALAFGGGAATNLASSGEDYERFYITAPELAAARWLGTTPRTGEPVYSDPYGQLRLNAVTDIPDAGLNDLTPRTLNRDAWVYASRTNVVDGRARGAVGSAMAVFEFPAAFLENNYDLVYANGSAEVFHR